MPREPSPAHADGVHTAVAAVAQLESEVVLTTAQLQACVLTVSESIRSGILGVDHILRAVRAMDNEAQMAVPDALDVYDVTGMVDVMEQLQTHDSHEIYIASNSFLSRWFSFDELE